MLGGPEPVNYAERIFGCGSRCHCGGRRRNRARTLIARGADSTRWLPSPGIIVQGGDGGPYQPGPGELLENLDDPLARPRTHRYGTIPEYLACASWRGSVSVITARGCPYRCNWCSHSVYGNTHRRRSPKAVVDEIEWIIDRYIPKCCGSPTMFSPSITDGCRITLPR